MSRQKGRRERPAPVRREFQERYSRRGRSRRPARTTPLTEREQWTDEIGPGRRWAAVLAGTVASVLSFGLIAASIVAFDEGNRSNATALSIGAALVVPVLLLVVAFVSRHPTPWRVTAFGAPVVVFLFLLGSFVARDPATGFVLGVGVGGAMAMRATEGVHLRSWRFWTVVGLAAYTKVVYLASPAVAIVAAPLLPLAGIGVIDRVMERRLEA